MCCAALGRRKRGSLLFCEGRLISAKSVCASLLIPHHFSIVWLREIPKSPYSGIGWKSRKSERAAQQAPLLLEFLSKALGRPDWNEREGESIVAFLVLKGQKPQAVGMVPILGERECMAMAWFVGYMRPCSHNTVRMGRLSPWRENMSLSLNNQGSSISDVLSLPVHHTPGSAALICSKRHFCTMPVPVSPSFLTENLIYSFTWCLEIISRHQLIYAACVVQTPSASLSISLVYIPSV